VNPATTRRRNRTRVMCRGVGEVLGTFWVPVPGLESGMRHNKLGSKRRAGGTVRTQTLNGSAGSGDRA
jgi:hypothetical protein